MNSLTITASRQIFARVVQPEMSGTSAENDRQGWLRKDPMQRLMNIREVSGLTGLSTHTLYAMVSKRQIPYVKVGRLTKFPPELIDKWLKDHTRLPGPS